MVGTVTPIVHGEKRRKVLPVSGFFHVLGSSVGGAVMGVLLAAFGGLAVYPVSHSSKFILFIVIGMVSLLGGLRELELIRFPFPTTSRQVRRSLRAVLTPKVSVFLYGAELGAALFTRPPSATIYCVAVWVALSGNPLQGAVTMATYGITRSIFIAIIAHRSETLDSASATTLRFQPLDALIKPLRAVGVSAAALIFLMAGIGIPSHY